MSIAIQVLVNKNEKQHLELDVTKPNTPPSDTFHIYAKNSNVKKIKGKNGEPDKYIVGLKPEDMALLDPKNEPVKEIMDGMIKRKEIIKK